jgi:MerR family copper efflux transcriptional regulator
MAEGRMQIGEVAERTGLSVHTIRFYEESGLVAPSARSQGGFRLYTDADVAQLERIRRLELLERLAMYRELADQRVPALHDRWASAAGLADVLRRHERRLRHAREIHS